MSTATFSQLTQTQQAIKDSKYTVVHFVPYSQSVTPYNGWINHATAASATAVSPGGVLCVMTEMGAISLDPIDENTVVKPGKVNFTYQNGTASKFDLTLDGNAVGTIKYLLGIPTSDKRAINLAQGNYNQIGSIIIDSYSISVNGGAHTLVSSILVYDVSMKITEIAGVANSGMNMQKISLYQNEGKILMQAGAVQWNWGLWWDNATITNAAAPDGSITTFNLKSVNYSGTSSAVTAIKSDPNNASALAQYFPVLRLGAANVTDSDATSSATVITFGTAPADGKSLLYICAIDTSAGPVPYETAATATGSKWTRIEDLVMGY